MARNFFRRLILFFFVAAIFVLLPANSPTPAQESAPAPEAETQDADPLNSPKLSSALRSALLTDRALVDGTLDLWSQTIVSGLDVLKIDEYDYVEVYIRVDEITPGLLDELAQIGVLVGLYDEEQGLISAKVHPEDLKLLEALPEVGLSPALSPRF